jgi:hypothetical protein
VTAQRRRTQRQPRPTTYPTPTSCRQIHQRRDQQRRQYDNDSNGRASTTLPESRKRYQANTAATDGVKARHKEHQHQRQRHFQDWPDVTAVETRHDAQTNDDGTERDGRQQQQTKQQQEGSSITGCDFNAHDGKYLLDGSNTGGSDNKPTIPTPTQPTTVTTTLKRRADQLRNSIIQHASYLPTTPTPANTPRPFQHQDAIMNGSSDANISSRQ